MGLLGEVLQNLNKSCPGLTQQALALVWEEGMELNGKK